MSNPSIKYAGALFSMLDGKTQIEETENLLEFLCDALKNADACFFFLNPTLAASIKKETLLKLLPENRPQLVLNFISILTDRNRLSLLPDILTEFKKLKASLENVVPIKVRSALELPKEKLDEIGSVYSKKFGGNSYVIDYQLDQSLIGGIVLHIGDFKIDASLKGELQSIRSLLHG